MFLFKVKEKINGCKHFFLRARKGQRMFSNFHSFFKRRTKSWGEEKTTEGRSCQKNGYWEGKKIAYFHYS